jgi:hypothetical protein
VTSGTGLTLVPEFRCQRRLNNTGRNADAGQIFFRHLHTIFQNHVAKMTPSDVDWALGMCNA